MYKPHTHCRACGYARTIPDYVKADANEERLDQVFSLGVQPLANDFVKAGEERAGYAPLEVLLCPRCGLAQLSVVVRPEILYKRYAYVTSKSQMMIDHFEALWRDISADGPVGSVLEIGSNDGTFLDWIKGKATDKVPKVLGIDPAENLTQAAHRKGVMTICGFFPDYPTLSLAGDTFGPGGEPDVIIARHVLCHVDNWGAFFWGVEKLCGPKTRVVIENPWVHDMLAANSFDQIYHEHLSYLSIGAVEAALQGSCLRLVRAKHYLIHGGAIVLTLARRDSALQVEDSVEKLRNEENYGPAGWVEFERRAIQLQSSYIRQSAGILAAGKTIAGLGASAKSTVWINTCHLGRKQIAFIADSTPGKQGTTSPGSDIPIVDEGAILREMPDYVVVFCWNFLAECVRKNARYLEKGGKFIVPIPEVRIIDKDNAEL